jgi:hypothetical protein
MRFPVGRIYLFSVATLLFACSPRQSKRAEQGYLTPADLSPKITYRIQEDLFTAQVPPAISAAMSGIFQKSTNPEVLWAMAQCGCQPAARTEVFRRLAVARGVLPQILVPTVREEIRGNPQLKRLLSLPELFGGLFKRILTSDERLSNQVRSGLSQKIQAAVGGDLKSNIPFRFDSFVTHSRDLKDNFSMIEMAARWNLVFATPNLWQGQTPVAFNSHGLQVLESIRVLSEWTYLFGIDPKPAGGFYGGMTIDASGSANTDLIRFDPREDPDARRIVSGAYRIGYNDAPALDLVINVQELWQRGPDEPTITEQAMIWNSAALAFSRLRADQRAATPRLYGPKGQALLPQDAHTLPLIFLPGMQGLLEGRLADIEKRTISEPGMPTERVSWRSLAKLGRAIMTWITVLDKIEAAQVPKAQEEQLKAAPTQLKEALRLVVLNILKDEALREPSRIPSIAEIAEAISFLADAEQKLLPSPHLQEVVVDTFHRFASQRLVPIWTGKTQDTMSVEDVLWTNMALSSMSRYPMDTLQAPWLPPLMQKVQAVAGKREMWP